LATSIQSAFVARLGPNYRLAKSADYRVLNDTVMPAAMVEVGFISNPGEEALLSTDAYRRKVADAVYLGVVQYFLLLADQKKRALPTVAVPVAKGEGGGV
jgi:N-acetylmuramoyl-L-alanine amidase